MKKVTAVPFRKYVGSKLNDSKNEHLANVNVLSFWGRGIIKVSGFDVYFGVRVIFFKQAFIKPKL